MNLERRFEGFSFDGFECAKEELLKNIYRTAHNYCQFVLFESLLVFDVVPVSLWVL